MNSTRVEAVVADLKSEDPDIQDRGGRGLGKLLGAKITDEERIQLLRAATEPWARGDADADTGQDLVETALSGAGAACVPAVLDIYSGLGEWGRRQAATWLLELGGPEGEGAFYTLVERHAPDGQVPSIGLSEIVEGNDHLAMRLLERLLPFADSSEFGYDLQLLVLEAVRGAFISPAALANCVGPVLDAYDEIFERVCELEQDSGADWIWTKAYSDCRDHAALILDLMGHLPTESVVPRLQAATERRDLRLVCFATVSLLRRGQAVAPGIIHRVAADAEVRSQFYDNLDDIDRLDLFPDEFKTQEALAESELVDWLVFPTELGRAPNEIELMDKFTDADRKTISFVFRFRTHEPHWAAEDGWMAGVSGPYLIDQIPTTDSGWATFSKFRKWDEASAEEHFEDIIGLMDTDWADEEDWDDEEDDLWDDDDEDSDDEDWDDGDEDDFEEDDENE